MSCFYITFLKENGIASAQGYYNKEVNLDFKLSNCGNQKFLTIIPANLRQIKNLYFNRVINFEEAILLIKFWREDDKYLLFKIENDKNISYLYSKCSKRGNDVYRYRVKKRHEDILKICEKANINLIKWDGKFFYSNILKFTNTVAIKRFDRDWFNKEGCSKYLDLFIKRIRNKYPNVKIARTYEVSNNGFLHVNIVCIFPDNYFKIRFHKSSKRLNRNERKFETWRLYDYKTKMEFDNFWEAGFIDIRAVENTNDLLEYVLKYQIKYFKNQINKEKQDLTLSTLSLYNKRSFSIPDKFKESIYSIIEEVKDIDINKILKSLEIRVHIIKHNSLKYKFLGIISADEIPFLSNQFYYEDDKPPPIEISY